jgi:hypothetical protein
MLGLKALASRYRKPRGKAEKPLRRRKDQAEKDLTGGADSWLTDEAFLRAKQRGIPGIPDARCFTLQSVIRGLAHLEGDVAECGVRFGKSTVFLLEANARPRQFHLFDSFEGLSEPSDEDVVHTLGRSYWTKGDIAAPEAGARATLSGYPDVHIHQGWIPDRFEAVADRSFALLHVDVDLYKPTLQSLEFFWPKLVAGGVVVCDDYGFTTCPGARRAMDEFFTERRAGIFELTTGQALAIKGED